MKRDYVILINILMIMSEYSIPSSLNHAILAVSFKVVKGEIK